MTITFGDCEIYKCLKQRAVENKDRYPFHIILATNSQQPV